MSEKYPLTLTLTPMLCARCQKNEATCFFSYASSSCSIDIKLGSDEKLPEGFGVRRPNADPSSFTRDQPRQLCRDCARQREQELIPDGSGKTWADQRESQQQMMESYEKKRRERCQKLGFTVDAQKKILARLERETPGLFHLHQPPEEFTAEKFSIEHFTANHARMKEKIAAAVAGEFAAHAISPEDIRMLEAGLVKLERNLWQAQQTIKEIARDFPDAPPEDRAALVFLHSCLREAHQRTAHTYADPKAADLLAVAGDVAETLYGETARAELQKMGIVSSATLGELVYRFIEKGILGQSESDRLEDFNVRSALDEFLEQRG